MADSPDIASAAEAQLAYENYPDDVLWDNVMAHTYYLLSNRYSVPENGEELRDRCRGVIIDALDRILIKGVRNWNRTHYPDFKIFLISVVDSIIIDEFRAFKRELRTVEYSGHEKDGVGADDSINSTDLSELCMSLMKGQNASEDELKILECIIAGLKMPGEVREYLEFDKNKFHNLSRSFSRKWDKVIVKLKEHGYE